MAGPGERPPVSDSRISRKNSSLPIVVALHTGRQTDMARKVPMDLGSLLQRAEEYAEYTMRGTGHVPPTLLAATDEGPILFIPQSMESDQAKDDFANTARLVCVAHDAGAAVLILEAWATVASPGQPLDTDTPPSEAFDRREFVVLMGEDRTGLQTQKLLPIIRTDAGGFFGFGEFHLPGLDNMKGRFARILSPGPPSDDMQNTARELLDSLGIRFSPPPV